MTAPGGPTGRGTGSQKRRRSGRSRSGADAGPPGSDGAPDAAAEAAGAGRLLDTWVDIERDYAAVRAERDRLRAEADAHATRLAEQERQVAGYRSQVETLGEELAGTRRRLEERTALGGQGGSGGSDRRLADYRDALLGMEQALAERDRAILQHAAEKAELAARIAGLERQFAEVTGRWRESDAANARLQALLTEAARGAERLEGELRQARAGNDRLARDLAEQSSRLAAMRADKAGQAGAQAQGEARTKELTAALAEERQRSTAALARLRERDDRLALLETALEKQRLENRTAEAARAAAESGLAAALERSAGQDAAGQPAASGEELAAREARIAELEARVAALTRDAAATENAAGLAVAARDRMAGELERKVAAAVDLEARVAALVTELEAQREAAGGLESELRRQRNTIAVLGREIERLEAIEAGTRRREEVSTRHGAAEADKRRKARLVVSLEGDHNIKYPLYKQAMIIGRASDADIHVIGRFTSRRHARIVITDDDSAVIEDLGSLNGIRVNDEVVARHVLRDGDMLDIGGARLQFIDLGQREAVRSNAG